MKVLIFMISVLAISTALAQNKKHEKSHAHRHHEAHEHGAATLAIAFDNLQGKIEFKGAAEGILGFEHEAKTEKDKETVTEAKMVFVKQIDEMVVFDPSLNCVFTIEKIGAFAQEEKKGSGKHSEWIANHLVTCKKSPVGTTVRVDFSKYKGLHDVDITILADGIQKSAEYKKAPVQIELK